MTSRRSPAAVAVLAALLVLPGCALLPGAGLPDGPSPAGAGDAPEPEPTAHGTPEAPQPELPPSRLPASIEVDWTQFAVPDSIIGTTGPEFRSPSGNLSCAIPGSSNGQFRAMCSAAQHTWSYEACDAPICPRFTMIDASGVAGAGANGGATTAFEVGHPIDVLAYGYSVGYDGVTCASTEDGMLCEDQTTRHGFLISRSEHIWF